jgi:hypothetical protein
VPNLVKSNQGVMNFLDTIEELMLQYGADIFGSRAEINPFYNTKNYANFVKLDVDSCYLSIDCDGTFRNVITPDGHFQATKAHSRYGLFPMEIFKSIEHLYSLKLVAIDESHIKYYLIPNIDKI